MNPWLNKNGSTIHINETAKYPNPNWKVSLKIFLGTSFLMTSENHNTRDRMLKYHKAQGLFPSAHKLPRIKGIIFGLFGGFNRIWQS